MSMVCVLDGVETNFTRAINEKGVGEYRINGKLVKWEAYSKILSQMGVLTKVRALPFTGALAASRLGSRRRPRRGPRRLVSAERVAPTPRRSPCVGAHGFPRLPGLRLRAGSQIAQGPHAVV